MNQLPTPEISLQSQNNSKNTEANTPKSQFDTSEFKSAQAVETAKVQELATEIKEGKYDGEISLGEDSKNAVFQFLQKSITPRPGKKTILQTINNFVFVRKGSTISLNYLGDAICSFDLNTQEIETQNLFLNINFGENGLFSIHISTGRTIDFEQELFSQNCDILGIDFHSRKKSQDLNYFGVTVEQSLLSDLLARLNKNRGVLDSFKKIFQKGNNYTGEDIENLEFYFIENSLYLGEYKITSIMSIQSLQKILIQSNPKDSESIFIRVYYTDPRNKGKEYCLPQEYLTTDFIKMMKNAQKIKA